MLASILGIFLTIAAIIAAAIDMTRNIRYLMIDLYLALTLNVLACYVCISSIFARFDIPDQLSSIQIALLCMLTLLVPTHYMAYSMRRIASRFSNALKARLEQRHARRRTASDDVHEDAFDLFKHLR